MTHKKESKTGIANSNHLDVLCRLRCHYSSRFHAYGNKHLFSDTFGRSKILTKDELKNLDSLLANAVYEGESGLTHPRNDDIQHFYYFKTSLREHEIRLNIAKKVMEDNHGRTRVSYFFIL